MDIGQIGKTGAGTFRAWLDGSEFSAMTSDGALNLDWGGTAHLDVALVGGVMLNAESSFDLIDANSQTGDWDSGPNTELWTTTTGGGQASVTLAGNRGNLDASKLGESVSIGAGDNIRGYVDVQNMAEGEKLWLGLIFSAENDAGGSAFVADLEAAGYDFTILPTFDGVEYHIGLGMTSRGDADGNGYFAYDFSAYNNSPQLELDSITVIPEPSTLGILLLAGLVTVIRRLRMRRG